jgi:hypothetical protein
LAAGLAVDFAAGFFVIELDFIELIELDFIELDFIELELAAGFLAAGFLVAAGFGACATCLAVVVVWLAIAVPVKRNAEAIRAQRNLFMNISLMKTWGYATRYKHAVSIVLMLSLKRD